MSDDQGSFAFESPMAETAKPPAAQRRRLSNNLEYSLLMLKLLSHYRSFERLQSDMALRARTDRAMGDFLNAFNKWNEPAGG
jgi:hypothetical protein